MIRPRNNSSPQGIAAVFAVLSLAIISTLAIAMISLARTNSRITMNQDSAERARTNAETGMRWMAWEFASVTLPQTDKGSIDASLASSLWPTIVNSVLADTSYGLNRMPSSVVTKREITYDAQGHAQLHVVVSVPGPDPIDFEVLATSGPTAPAWAPTMPSYTSQAQVIGVQSRGSSNGVTRIIRSYFLMQKTFRYALLTKIPVQLGKNTAVEGDVFYAARPKDTQPPVLSISDFRYTSTTTSDALTSRIQAYEDFLKNSRLYTGLDNRIPVSNTALVNALHSANSALASASDYNGDGYIDEYDLFLQYFDSNGNRQVSQSEFLGIAPSDPNLFYLIDRNIGEPLPGDPAAPRAGYADGYCNGQDPYAKITGQVHIWETQSQLATRLASNSQKIEDVLQGTIVPPDGYSAPVVFGQQNPNDPAALITPASFNQSAFLDLTGSGAGSPVKPAKNPLSGNAIPEPDPVFTALAGKEYANTTVSASSMANGTIDNAIVTDMRNNGDSNFTFTATTVYKRDANGNILKDASNNPITQSVQALTSVKENVPYGSSGVRSTVTRPVVSGMNFRNCVLNRGSNALFINCTFDGVTFVDGAYTMQQNVSDYPKGNNLRFLNCTFTGPLVQGDAAASGSNRGATPTDYTDYTNSWEFSGTTTFDLRQPSAGGIGSKDGTVDSLRLIAMKEQATIQAPNTNIEMGSYTSPGNATCSFQGVVVAGCFDCRGVADIDGAIIVPASAAGNATLGYFGSNDNATSQGEPDPRMKDSGNGAYGRIHIRYNPLRRLPDGIMFSVSVLPDVRSMQEVTQWQDN